MSRNDFRSVARLALILVSACGVSAAASPAAENQHIANDSDVRRVDLKLDISGDLEFQGEGDQSQSLPLNVQAEFRYDERILQEVHPYRIARHYDQATAQIRVGDGNDRLSLPEEVRDFVLESGTDPRSARLRFRRPVGVLSVEHSELLEVPMESAMLDAFLPAPGRRDVKDEWTPDSDRIAPLFGLDSVTRSELTCQFHRVEDGTAKIVVSGKVFGAIHGVASEIDARGMIDYSIPTRQLTRVRFSLTERRSISQAAPGFNLRTQLDMQLSPSPQGSRLDDRAIADWNVDLNGSDGETSNLLTYRSQTGNFEFEHSREWLIMSDSPSVSVLRLVEHGDLVAQCNISRLPDLGSGVRLGVDEFRNEVAEALKKFQGRISAANVTTIGEQMQVIRVEASGVASEIPIQWHYFHVTDREGRRAAIVVSVEQERYEQFAERDNVLVESLTFHARREPTTAEEGTAADERGGEELRAGANGASASRRPQPIR